jgi:LmbE family N-acetylglucosaminyl deacetylase
MKTQPVQSHQRLFIPDNLDTAAALKRITRLGIGAHQDDLEFMALEGILAGYQNPDEWFGGIICTDGANSARQGPYASYTSTAMQKVRENEQEATACVGQYAFVAQLAYPSKTTKSASQRASLIDDISNLIELSQPDIIYAHNPFDKHATHVGVFKATLDAILKLPESRRPRKLIGCEVWRGLDWLPDELKVIQDLTPRANLAAALNGIFDSQITGGKRYDLAVEGRRLANATFLDAFQTDAIQRCAYGIDMTALITEPLLSLEAFVQSTLEHFNRNIRETIASV